MTEREPKILAPRLCYLFRSGTPDVATIELRTNLRGTAEPGLYGS
jgi:hypothetical protein